MAGFKIQYTLSDKNSKFYKPVGNGDINVIENMAWTLSPILPDDNDVPYVELKEYQQTTGQLIAALAYYGRVFTRIEREGAKAFTEPDDPLEVYKYKYFAEATGFTYVLPYFNPKKLARTNTFGSEESPFTGILQLGREIKAFGTAKGVGAGIAATISSGREFGGAAIAIANTMLPGAINFENPQSWTGTGTETIEVTFDLFNTGTWDEVENNRRFCHLFSYQNTPSRRNFAIVDPPVIYSLKIPDVVQFPACYVSSLNITNLGNTRTMVVDGGKRTVPEAYRISITFTALLMPTRNLMSDLEKGGKVEAISDVRKAQRFADLFQQALSEGFENNDTNKLLRQAGFELDEEMGNPLGTAERLTVNPFRLPPR